MSKKNFLTKILLVVAVFCMSIGMLTFNANPVSVSAAEQTLPTVSTVTMKEGASVRVKTDVGDYKDVTGIRFTLLVNKSYYDGLVAKDGDQVVSEPTVGMYVAIANQTTEDVMKSESAATVAKFHFIAEQLVEKAAGESAVEAVYQLNAVIAGIDTDNYNTSLIANGYLKNGESAPTFATNPQTRSVAQVASVYIANNLDLEEEALSDYKDFVDGAVTDDNFKFANTAITTDMYKSAQPTVGATLPENLTAVWSSSNEEVATVDASGNLTRVGEGETTITATLGRKTRSATLTIGAPTILTVDSSSVENVSVGGVRAQYLAADNEEIKGFSGDYSANVAKLTWSSGSQNFKATAPYTTAELEEINKYYTNVSMWMAYDATGTGAIYSTGTSIHRKAGGAWSSMNQSGRQTWVKYTVTIADYMAIISSNETLLLKICCDTGTSDVSDVKIYFGDIFFEKIIPTVLSVTADTASNIIRGGTTGTYVAAGADEIKDFAGDYAGAASKMVSATGQNCFVKTSYTAEEITALKAESGYTHVSMWMAVSASLNVGGESVYTKAVGSTWGAVSTVNTWVKYTVSIEDFVGQLSDGQVLLINFQTSDVNVYFGDIIFETITE